MDPDANLTEQLDLANMDWTGKESDELTPDEIDELHVAHIRLCELVEALDRWIVKGGFLPTRWRTK